MTLTRSEVEAMLARAEAATKEPWLVERQPSDSGGAYITGHITAEAHNYAGNRVVRRDSVCHPESMTAKDADFIAAARTDLPALARAYLDLEARHAALVVAAKDCVSVAESGIQLLHFLQQLNPAGVRAGVEQRWPTRAFEELRALLAAEDGGGPAVG